MPPRERPRSHTVCSKRRAIRGAGQALWEHVVAACSLAVHELLQVTPAGLRSCARYHPACAAFSHSLLHLLPTVRALVVLVPSAAVVVTLTRAV